MPQKICLMYSTHEGRLKFRMTLNIPTYTKTSKIYKDLLSILFEVKSKEAAQKLKEESSIENIVGKNKVAKLELSYIDLFVQSCLK
jgi:hypothetical protein